MVLVPVLVLCRVYAERGAYVAYTLNSTLPQDV
jgi:hypothetical protein